MLKIHFDGRDCLGNLGAFQFYIAKTPPKVDKSEKVTISDVLGLDALKLLKDKTSWFSLFRPF